MWNLNFWYLERDLTAKTTEQSHLRAEMSGFGIADKIQ